MLANHPEPYTLTDWLKGQQPPVWVRHGTADVAVLSVDPPASVRADLVARALTPNLLLGVLEAPPRNRPTLTIGFPLGLGVDVLGPDARVSAITREARPASGLLTFQRFDNKKTQAFFLLDSPSLGGFSGSPVFLFPGAFSEGPGVAFSNLTLCVGLVHGNVREHGQSHMAAVVPARYIAETLERAVGLHLQSGAKAP